MNIDISFTKKEIFIKSSNEKEFRDLAAAIVQKLEDDGVKLKPFTDQETLCVNCAYHGDHAHFIGLLAGDKCPNCGHELIEDKK